MAGVDEWQAERVAQIGLEADRRREEHRGDAAAALARIRGRGESIAALAQLANISEGEMRSYLTSASRAKRAATAVHAGHAWAAGRGLRGALARGRLPAITRRGIVGPRR